MEAPPLPVPVGSPPTQSCQKEFRAIFFTINCQQFCTLNHKIPDDSVKLGVDIVASTTEFSEIPASVWGMIPIQLDDDFTHPKIKAMITELG